MFSYIRDGAEIYHKSFDIIRSEANLDRFPSDLESVIVRIIHSCGMTDIVEDIDFSVNVATAARESLQAGGNILCDSEMVARGVTQKFLPQNNQVICTLNHPSVPELAIKNQNTRSAVAVELWQEHLGGAVVAIGNAPTALFRLLELLESGYPQPAVILGFPVGFVGAIESKVSLTQNILGIPFLTIHGRRGGSSMAAAAINALGIAAHE